MSIAEKASASLEVRATKFNAIREAIYKAKGNLAMALPRHMTPDRMLRITLSACSRQPKLLDCTPASIALALINASETGLEPNGREAHLIPYRNNANGTMEAQFQADYKGLVQLAYRSGFVKSFHAAAVYEKDEFEFRYGSGSFIRHVPTDEDDAGQLRFAYAIAELKDGGEKFVVLNRRQVMKRKSSSKTSGGNTPWQTHEEAMWAKSAAKELCKWIPLSAEMQRAVELDDQTEGGQAQPAIDMELPDAPPSSLDELANRLGGPSVSGKATATDTPASTDAAPSTSDPIANLPALLAACTGKLEVRKLYDELCGPESTLSQDAADKANELCKAREAEIEAGRGGK